MIELVEVTKRYERGGEIVTAVDGVSARIERGTLTFILGPSGSGKTTLLHLLGALTEVTSGEIVVGGRSLTAMSASEIDDYRRSQVGFIFQNFNLIANLSALDNVLVPFLPSGGRGEYRDKAQRLLEDLGLGGRLRHRPAELSGGEQQRVAIARALLKQPDLILADEPTGELDTTNGQKILEILHGVCAEQRTTVVIVTHDRDYIRDGDHVLTMRDGRLITPTITPVN